MIANKVYVWWSVETERGTHISVVEKILKGSNFNRYVVYGSFDNSV